MTQVDNRNPVGRPPTGKKRDTQQSIFISRELFKALQRAGQPYRLSGQAVFDLIAAHEFGTPDSFHVNVTQSLRRAMEEINSEPLPAPIQK